MKSSKPRGIFSTFVYILEEITHADVKDGHKQTAVVPLGLTGVMDILGNARSSSPSLMKGFPLELSTYTMRHGLAWTPRLPALELKTLASPLENIPLEVIAQFFIAFLDTLTFGNVRNGIRSLCLTCKEWRDLVYVTPDLWTVLDFHVQPDSSEYILLAVESWLRRSRQLPLKIKLTVIGSGPLVESGNIRLANKILQVLFDEVHRWSSISISISCDEFTAFPTFNRTTKASILGVVEVAIPFAEQAPEIQWIILLIQHSPRLHTFIGNGPRMTLPLARLPLAQLSIFKLSSPISSPHALEIVGQMPVLSICHLVLNYPAYSDDPTPRQIVCTACELRITVRADISQFFTPLLVPNLDTFELHLASNPRNTALRQNLLQFLRKTEGRLTSFSIRNLFIKDVDLLDCLNIVSPHLKQLHILVDRLTSSEFNDVENFTGCVIEALTHGEDIPGRKILCPRLENLTLERCIGAEDGQLSRMIASRRKHHNGQYQYQIGDATSKHVVDGLPTSESGIDPFSNLISCNVVFRYHSHPDDRERLNRLRQGGLNGRTEFGYPRRT